MKTSSNKLAFWNFNPSITNQNVVTMITALLALFAFEARMASEQLFIEEIAIDQIELDANCIKQRYFHKFFAIVNNGLISALPMRVTLWHKPHSS